MEAFANRREAGRALATRLAAFGGRTDVVVLALPRGGVPVAYEIALALGAPLDVLLVRKLGVPEQPEVAMGAIATGDVCVLDRGMMRQLGVSRAALATVLAQESAELERRERVYRGTRPLPEMAGRTVILVDDGLATGATMAAAVSALERHDVAGVVVAVPVASGESVRGLTEAGCTVVALMVPKTFIGVGRWYRDFEPTSDEEVLALLDAAWSRRLSSSHAAPAEIG